MQTTANILDSRKEDPAVCYLCKISLEDYLKGLPEDYMNYDIQREIVSNVYLDQLVDTVLALRHIPPIVLVVAKEAVTVNSAILKMSDFKILDGLQRTFRLKAIKDTIDFCLSPSNNVSSDIANWSKYKVSRQFSSFLRDIKSNTDIFMSIVLFIKAKGLEQLKQVLSKNIQWYEIWTGLSPEEEVRKMLTLNAGHKPVKARHQIELLFLHILDYLRTGVSKNFKVIREKELKAQQAKQDAKGREKGVFYFGFVITSLLSLADGKPLAPSASLIQDLQEDQAIEKYSNVLSTVFLKQFVDFLVTLDNNVCTVHGTIGNLWISREVSLTGLFGGIGYYAKQKDLGISDALKLFEKKLISQPKLLALDSFEHERNSLDLGKVNFGSINKKAVFDATYDILNTDNIRFVPWKKYFKIERQS